MKPDHSRCSHVYTDQLLESYLQINIDQENCARYQTMRRFQKEMINFHNWIEVQIILKTYFEILFTQRR